MLGNLTYVDVFTAEGIGSMLTYIAVFGFNDYIVKYANIKGNSLIVYYSFVFAVGVLLLTNHRLLF